KQFAPRMISGRIPADAVCLLADNSALLILQQQKIKQPTGEDTVRQTLTIADSAHVVALEFPDAGMLTVLNIPAPLVKTSLTGSHPTIPRPALSGERKVP